MNMAIYVRVSTQRQAQTQTIEQQLHLLREYSLKQGWEWDEQSIFRDDGYSGASLRRPGLDRLRDQVRNAAFDRVLITEPSRLARKYVHQMLLMEEFERGGCQIEFLDQPMSGNPHDQLLVQIRGAVAEYERSLIAERMRRGRLQKYRAGLLLPWTVPPFGYRVDPSHPRDPAGGRVEPAEAAVVAEMFEWYQREHQSLVGLTKHLMSQKIPNPRGKLRWNQATVRGILRNPVYTGTVFLGRYRVARAHYRQSALRLVGHDHGGHPATGPHEWEAVAQIPAIVKQEQFDLVQSKFAQNQQYAHRNNTAHPYLLRALVSCGACHLSCTGRYRSGKAGVYAYYTCRVKSNPVISCRDDKCHSRFIPAGQLDELVWKDVCEVLLLISPPMGGAFGAKTFVRTEAIAACLARKAKRPVKIMLSRYEEWLTLNRHPATIQVRLGACADGTLVAKRVVCWVDTGAYADCGPGVAQKMGYAAVGPYRIPHVWVDSQCIYTNLPPNGAFRGYGAMQAVWASERTMDLLAARLGMDPLAIRLKNVLADGDQFCTGEIMHDVHFIECLHAIAEKIGWAENKQGKGLCVLMKGMQTPSRASIVVEANDDGSYTVHCATAEMGQGAWPSIRMMAADLLGVDPEKVHYPEPDTDIVPYDTRTTSSRSTYMMGRALVEAVRDLRRKGELGYGECVNTGGLDLDTGQGIASTHWHQGAAAAEVRVDEETGKFQVLKLYAAIYAGHVVNRPGAELQNEGSMIMGLGTTLFEEITFEEGQPTNANLSDYYIPAAGDLPESFTSDLLEREGAEVHGLGETALPPVPPAIGNALYSFGIHLTDLPLSPEAVLRAIDSREQAKGGRS